MNSFAGEQYDANVGFYYQGQDGMILLPEDL